MISLQHITRRFHDVVAVDDVSLEVAEGEVLGFLGPNGAGKTTTLRILTGFLPATSGRAVVAGHDVASDSLGARTKLGYLPEHVPLPLDARVDEYLEFRGRLKGIAAKERPAARERALGSCGLLPVRRRILGQLSRGYRQRVGLADALLADPPVLVLDEATTGLDPGQRQELLDLVAALAGRRTVIVSSHVLSEVEHSCTRVAIIKAGRIVAQGTREELGGRQAEVAIAAPGAGARLASMLDERQLRHRPDGRPDTLRVELPRPEEGPALLAALVRAGLPVARFEPRALSLQEIFLDLVRDEPA